MNTNSLIRQTTYTSSHQHTPATPRKLGGKIELFREAKTVLTMNAKAFQEKELCDGITLNLGDACAFSCTYCYVDAMARKFCGHVINDYNSAADLREAEAKGHSDVILRRRNALEILNEQLLKYQRSGAYSKDDKRVVYSSTLVDVAGNTELLRETAAACNQILSKTSWQIRLLSKSPLLGDLIFKGLIEERFHKRLILGLSLGTLDDKIAASIEVRAGSPTRRINALHELQDAGIRTFGMICPSLPQADYITFAREMAEAIRPDKCEHVWAEVINVRGASFLKTKAALARSGHLKELELLKGVCGPGTKAEWDAYAKATYEAHLQNIPAHKLRYLQYVTPNSIVYWSGKPGVVCLGKASAAHG